MNFQSLRVSTRIQSLVALMLLGMLLLCGYSLVHLRDTLLEDRKEKTRNLVETGVGILTHFHKQSQAGLLSEADAQRAARETLRGVRYGNNDYYFIIDANCVYILFPTKPEFEGQNKRDMKDSNGKLLLQELVKAAKSGGGFVDYWFPKGGKTVPEPKLSYATDFAPWGWIIGTGVYISDVDEHYRKGAITLGSIAVLLIALLSVLGWRIGASILRQLGGEPAAAAAIMRNVAAGDLTASASAPRETLLGDLSDMVATLRNLIRAINDEANGLVRHAGQIRQAADHVAGAAAQQADATSSMAAAIEELTVSSNHISDSARDTEQDSRSTMALASEGNHRVGEASSAIQTVADVVTHASERIRSLEERARQISSVANVIKEIADQTNLLALNAAIEAARAGEQGRGFAVVADEVRKLAERTAIATTEIESMITGIQSDTSASVAAMDGVLPKVGEGVQLAQRASEALRNIETGTNRSLEHVAEVANATAEQSSASTSIAKRVEEIAIMVEETNETIQGTVKSSQELEQIAQKLKAQISQFKV